VSDRRPRELTPAVRAELGLAEGRRRPYPYAFAALVVVTASVPLLLASMWSATVAAMAIGLVLLPLVRYYENREVSRREDIYRFGSEAKGRVLDVEPATGPGRADHIVRLEFRAEGSLVQASVIGCPLARRGLAPDDAVVLLYAPDHPSHCLVLRKEAPDVVDAIFD
jgi:hypothetical protein